MARRPGGRTHARGLPARRLEAFAGEGGTNRVTGRAGKSDARPQAAAAASMALAARPRTTRRRGIYGMACLLTLVTDCNRAAGPAQTLADEMRTMCTSWCLPWCRVTHHLSVCAGHRSATPRCHASPYNPGWGNEAPLPPPPPPP